MTRENRVRRRVIGAGAIAGLTLLSALLLPAPVRAASVPAPTLPVEAKGVLGVLDTSGASATKVVFDTSTGLYALDGKVRNTKAQRRDVDPSSRTLWGFDFDSIRLGPATKVTVRGGNPLVLLSKNDATIDAPLVLDGAPGANGGRGAGGGGGGGGGAVSILARGTLKVTGLISVNGGPGGVGNAAWDPIPGGDGGAGAVALASPTKVVLGGAIRALTGGKPDGKAGPLLLAGPASYTSKATFNGVPIKDAGVKAMRSLPSAVVYGGAGGGGGGGTGLPKVVTPDYVKTMSPGGLPGPGGGSGGSGSYAVAGGQGGNGGTSPAGGGGGGGGGGAYAGPGGSAGPGAIGAGGGGDPGVAGSCPTNSDGGKGGNGGGGAGVGGTGGTRGIAGGAVAGAGNPGVATTHGGGGGGGGGAIDGGAGAVGGAGNGNGAGGGGGGGADGCVNPAGRGGGGGAGGVGMGGKGRGKGGGLGRPLAQKAAAADLTGLDYDPGCVLGLVPPVAPPGPNSIVSPGLPGGTVQGGQGCIGASTYDGNTEGIDLNHATAALELWSAGSGQIGASWKIDGHVPEAGSTDKSQGNYNLPDGNFVGGNFFALFQNKAIQTNVAYVACPQIPPRPTPILQRFGSWKDGYHFFLAFSVSWDGTKWIHSAQLGQYSPDGGFGFFELGVDDGTGWSQANIHHPYTSAAGADNWAVSINGTGPTSIEMVAPGVYKSPDTTNCANGHFDYWFAKAGDDIANAKALTTANQVVTLPVTVPLSLTCSLSGGLICENDITSVGGFVFWADTTDGNSTAGLFNTNITGIALTAGLIGGVDTLGPGPTCPTPTVGGAIPQNPLFTPNTACHIDDDSTSRGSFFQEFWDTVHGFTF